MKPAIIAQEATYSFADYYKLMVDVEEVVGYFGYAFQAQLCILPRSSPPLVGVETLQKRIENSLPHLSLTSEIARREFLIAPILLDLIQYVPLKIRVEYPIEVSPQLRGTLDYYLQATHRLLVIEAKQGDLQRGFTQLAVELIALDQWLDQSEATLYGAVSLGDIWRFGLLDRASKTVTQDLNLYRVPADLVELFAILIGILQGET
jgi:hypothetical protein